MGLKGHSRHYGWGWSEGPRLPTDCVVVETMPDAPRTYLYDGSPVEMRIEPYVIEVAGEDDIRGEFEYTAHNGVMSPIMHRSGRTAYAVSSVYMARAGLAHVQFRDMLLASNDAEMEEALAQREIYPANLVYSGSDGSINYIRPGRIPIRPEGFDGVKPVDGNTSAGAWLGLRVLDEILRLKRPTQGYLTNSNVSPDMMFGEPFFRPEDHPPDFAFQPGLTGTRQRRSIQLLEGDRQFTFEEALDVVRDAFVMETDLWGPAIAQALEDSDGAYARADAEYREFLDTLTAFGGYFVPESRGALFHALVRIALRSGERATAVAIESAINTRTSLTSAQQETLLELAASTYTELSSDEGLAKTFGSVFRIGRGGTSEPSRGFTLGQLPGNPVTDFQSLWAAFYTPADEAGLRWSRGGSRHAFLVQLGPIIRSFSLASHGASDDSTSSHYSDQSHLIGQGRLHSNFFEPDELAGSLSSTRTMSTR
jgi:acyl-homoserine lactone acylase PvdQ